MNKERQITPEFLNDLKHTTAQLVRESNPRQMRKLVFQSVAEHMAFARQFPQLTEINDVVFEECYKK